MDPTPIHQKKSCNMLVKIELKNILVNKKPHLFGGVFVGPAGLEPATP